MRNAGICGKPEATDPIGVNAGSLERGFRTDGGGQLIDDDRGNSTIALFPECVGGEEQKPPKRLKELNGANAGIDGSTEPAAPPSVQKFCLILSGCPGDTFRYRCEHQAEQLQSYGFATDVAYFDQVDSDRAVELLSVFFATPSVSYGGCRGISLKEHGRLASLLSLIPTISYLMRTKWLISALWMGCLLRRLSYGATTSDNNIGLFLCATLQ